MENPVESDAKSEREKVLHGDKPPHPNLGMEFDANLVPPGLSSERNWLPFSFCRGDDGKWTKISRRMIGGRLVYGFSNTYPEAVAFLKTLPELIGFIGSRPEPMGLMFAPMMDEDGTRRWVCLDVDNVDPSNPETWPALIADAKAEGKAGWCCSSVSGKGLRILGWVDAGRVSEFSNANLSKTAGTELKANTPSTVTTDVVWSCDGLEITDLWLALLATAPPKKSRKPKAVEYQGDTRNDSNPEYMARLVSAAWSWIAKKDSVTAGNGRHDGLMTVAAALAGGFGLRDDAGFELLQKWNDEKCTPPVEEWQVARKWVTVLDSTAGDSPTLRKPVDESWQKHLDWVAGQANGAKKNDAAGNDAPPSDDDSEPEHIRKAKAGEARAKDGRRIVVPDSDRLEITRGQVCVALAELVTAKVYQRSGTAVLVRETDARIKWKCPKTGKTIIRGPETRPSIVLAENGHLLSTISRSVAWRKVKAEKLEHDPSEILSRPGEKSNRKPSHRFSLVRAPMPGQIIPMVKCVPAGLPPLKGLLFGPTYDAATDTIIADPGYHPTIGLEMVSTINGIDVPEKVTREQAKYAAEEILNVYRFFPWPEDADNIAKARLLVAMVTALLRWNFGPAPCFMVRGKSAGSGKTEITKSISEIVHGTQPRLMSWVIGKHAEDELRKRFCMLLASGETMVVIDNAPTGAEIDSATLNALLTTHGEFSDRQLGSNSAGASVGGPNHLAVYFTGNSIIPSDDLSERTLTIDLDAPREGNRRGVDPSTFGEIGELIPYVKKHRAKLLGYLLTIVRGFQQANRPKTHESHWGSFGDWLDQCVGPVAWALGVDPLRGLIQEWGERSTAGDGLIGLAEILRSEKYRGRKFYARELFDIATPEAKDECRTSDLKHDKKLADALSNACGLDDITKASTKLLGRRLSAYCGKPKTGLSPQVNGTHIKLSDGSEWCLMAAKDTHTKLQKFWLAPFFSAAEFAGNAESNFQQFVLETGVESETLKNSNSPTPEYSTNPWKSDTANTTNNATVGQSSFTPLTPLEALESMTAKPVPWDDLARAWQADQWPAEWLEKNLWTFCEQVGDRIQSKAARARAKANGRA